MNNMLQLDGCLLNNQFEIGLQMDGKYPFLVRLHCTKDGKNKGFSIMVKPWEQIENFDLTVAITRMDTNGVAVLKLHDVRNMVGLNGTLGGVEKFFKCKNLRSSDYGKIFRLSLNFTVYPCKERFAPRSVTLQQTIGDLFLNPLHSDFVIHCENRAFPCHKFVLAARSDVFKAMLQNENSENLLAEVTLNDVHWDTLETMLAFLYTDNVDLSKICSDLLVTADKYNVSRLYEICVFTMKKNLSVHNVLETMVTAFLVNSEELMKASSTFALEHRGQILKGENWDRIKLTYPQIAAKVLDEIIFNAQLPPAGN